jgi:hypothetical protein
MMEAIPSPETSVLTTATRRNIPEDVILYYTISLWRSRGPMLVVNSHKPAINIEPHWPVKWAGGCPQEAWVIADLGSILIHILDLVTADRIALLHIRYI